MGRRHVETVSRSWSGEAFHSSKTVPIMTENSEDERDRTQAQWAKNRRIALTLYANWGSAC